jgi:metal-responsive CopG/Arc/MetJ family transcriptional regulator
VEYTVEEVPQLKTIQVVFDPELLRAADRAAKRSKKNRSAFFREAVQAHLRHLEVLELESSDRRGYESTPATSEAEAWEAEAAWPAG